MSIENLKLRAQSVLDDLWSTDRLPFKLEACKIDSLGLDEYSIRFYDSRLHSVTVICENGDSFEDLMRSAILARVKRIDAPLRSEVVKVLSRYAA